MDINAIKQRLSQLKETNTKQSNLWKPSPGTQQVRIVPYKYNKDNPFIELYFHYDVAKRTYLSPISFGRPDPIEEFATKLKQTGNKDDWRLGRKLDAKMRTFLPVVVRGEEAQGVKFWGFGKTVYQELLGFIADPDYGDIADPMSGRDISVEFKTAEETGANFPSTSIRVKPNQTPITEDKEQLKSLIENQVEITSIYTEQSYDELKEVLQNYLNPSDAETNESGDVGNTETATDDGLDKVVDTKTEKNSDVEAAFDDLFNS
tara:strand:- start:236 stop:1021 length:786 start_codon:yes stop_codon:yes gene_type:complete